MDYKKKYEQALERARQVHTTNVDENKKSTEYIFPELKESDDEMVRKWIRNELESKYVVDNIVNNVMADKALTWLEKQGEQKPNPCDGCINRKGCINCENGELRETEHKPTEWSEEDEHCIELLLPIIDSSSLIPKNRKRCKEFLESLKERYTWKPSDEQMKQLGWVAEQNKNNIIGKELMSLYQDLKKLKEE